MALAPENAKLKSDALPDVRALICVATIALNFRILCYQCQYWLNTDLQQLGRLSIMTSAIV